MSQKKTFNSLFVFDKNDIIMCEKGPTSFKATILQRTVRRVGGTDKPMYFVHYNGWNKQCDEWVSGSRCSKPDSVRMHSDRKRPLPSSMREEKNRKRPRIQSTACIAPTPPQSSENTNNAKTVMRRESHIHNPQPMNKVLTVEEMLAQLQYSLVQVGAKHGQCLKAKATKLTDMERRYNGLKAAQKKNNEKHELEYNELKKRHDKVKDKCDELKIQNELNQALMEQQNGKYNKLMDKCDELKKEHDVTSSTLRVYEGHSKSIDAMSLEKLNGFKSKLERGLKKIEQAKEQFFERKWKCVACLDRCKNMSFDSCGHIALCDQCERKNISKLCPMCQTAYNNAKQVNFG
eukprot:447204_1